MSSQLRVDSILPSAGTALGIGTASGSITFNSSNISGDVIFNDDVTVNGLLTYEDVTNIDSVGVVTARDSLHVTGGSVGIGTDNPSNLLHVYGQSRFEDYLRGNSTHNKLYILDDVAISATKKLYFDGGSNTYIDEVSADTLRFTTGGSERLRITEDGDLYMHGNAPTHSTSSGSIFLSPPTGNPNRGIMWSNTSDTHYVKLEPSVIDGLTINGYSGVAFATGSRSNSTWTERLRITNAGLVGIGTAAGSSSSTRLVVYEESGNAQTIEIKAKNTGGVGSQPGIRFTAPNNDNIGAVYADVNSDSLNFSTGNFVQRLRIDSSGRLLCGTSNGSGEPIAAFQGRSNDANDSGIVAITRTGTNPSGSIGELRFATGSDFNKYYGMIICQSDGSTSSTSLPGVLRFSTTASGSTSPTDRLRIDSDGRVTKPTQPRFIAKLSGNATYNPSGFGNYIDFNSEEYDIGGNFTTSGTDQGLFTAPVAGLYHFSAAAYGASVSWTQSWFVVNGSRKNYSDWVLSSTSDFVQNSQAIYLNAGDKVGFHPHRGGSSNYTIYANVHHTYFSGYLIG